MQAKNGRMKAGLAGDTITKISALDMDVMESAGFVLFPGEGASS
jgi:hypothetical protein